MPGGELLVSSKMDIFQVYSVKEESQLPDIELLSLHLWPARTLEFMLVVFPHNIMYVANGFVLSPIIFQNINFNFRKMGGKTFIPTYIWRCFSITCWTPSFVEWDSKLYIEMRFEIIYWNEIRNYKLNWESKS